MAEAELTFTGLAVALMEASHLRLKRAMDGLTEAQLHFQPAPAANSIGWLVWHLSRWKDLTTARLAGETEVWSAEGWAARCGLPEDYTGYGDGPEQVAAFRVALDLLTGYRDAAHEAALGRVRGLTEEQLSRPHQHTAISPVRPAWRSVLTNIIDFTEHTGQVAYLRGILTGPEW